MIIYYKFCEICYELLDKPLIKRDTEIVMNYKLGDKITTVLPGDTITFFHSRCRK